MRLKNFTIDRKYCTSVTIRNEYSKYRFRNELTPEEMIEVLKGEDTVASISSKDHPEFDKLRRSLSEQGYIHMTTTHWNGDFVLKPFKLNDMLFRKNDRFVSAGAMGVRIDIQVKQITKKRILEAHRLRKKDVGV